MKQTELQKLIDLGFYKVNKNLYMFKDITARISGDYILFSYSGKALPVDRSLKSIILLINAVYNDGSKSFTEHEIQQLQSKVHAITGDGEIMMCFNELLGIGAG